MRTHSTKLRHAENKSKAMSRGEMIKTENYRTRRIKDFSKVCNVPIKLSSAASSFCRSALLVTDRCKACEASKTIPK